MRTTKDRLTKLLLSGLIACLALVGLLAVPTSSIKASEYPDEILLGAFWESDENTTDTLYWSLDGVNFYELSEAYTDATPTDSSSSAIAASVSYEVDTLHDPSIIYKDGYFWMLSGFTTTDSSLGRRYVPMIGYSEDLVNWSYPNSGSSTNVGVTETPPGSDLYGSEWDAVAPDFMVDDDGTVWITVSMGYYAQFHSDDGDSANDVMQPYLIQATGLSVPSDADTVSNKGAAPVVTYSDAVPINLPTYNTEVDNRIDGSFYKENGEYYYLVKKDGVTVEIWKAKEMSLEAVQDEDNWELVTDDVVTGYEGPCLTKFEGNYYLYTDKLKDYPPDDYDGTTGIYVNIGSIGTTGTLDSVTGWLDDNQIEIVAHSADGGTKTTRHGTVITITDTAAIKVIWDLKNTTRYASTTGTEYIDSTTGVNENFTDEGWYQKESFLGDAYGNEVVCYWYEDNVRQGYDPNWETDGYRGKEIYDPGSDGWYWLDSNADGKMAVSKDVYQDSYAGDDGDYTGDDGLGYGKWVRYDQFGKMLKGQVHAQIDGSDEWGYWYFDEITGAMKKGISTVYTVNSELVDLVDARTGKVQTDSDGNTAQTTSWYYVDADGNRVDDYTQAATKTVYYDETTGIMQYGYVVIGDSLYYFDAATGETIDGWYPDPDTGELYWYENSERQGYNVNDPDYRGKEIYDPTTDAWYWLDNVQQGAVAKGKDVYQESSGGKWVRYDQWGKMIKGWDDYTYSGSSYYFDPVTGAMAKGYVTVYEDDGHVDEHYFDENTGVMVY